MTATIVTTHGKPIQNIFTVKKAKREQVKLKIGLTGPSGAGKTLSALYLAYGITGDWSKICLADTENKSALAYAEDVTGEWNHIDFSPDIAGGYSPENWINLIEMVEALPGIEVLILDSISHAWEGKNGTLEIAEKSSGGSRNLFTPGWRVATPLQNAFVHKIRQSKIHLIATMRVKQDYVIEQNDKGKAVPKKVGLKPIQR